MTELEFRHPLAEAKDAQLPDGRIEPLLNNWAVASFLSQVVVTDPGNQNAYKHCLRFCEKVGVTAIALNKLIKRTSRGDQAALREMQNAIANGFQDTGYDAAKEQGLI